jgi:hypothetical protein
MCSPVAGVNGDSRQIAEKLLVRLKNKQTNKQKSLVRGVKHVLTVQIGFPWHGQVTNTTYTA